MTTDSKSKTLGQAIDEIIGALRDLDERSRAVAIKAACEQLDVQLATSSPARADGSGTEYSEAGTDPGRSEPALGSVLDVRSLKEKKQPGSATEMACVVAYYVKSAAPQNERKDAIGSADLEKYFVQADYPLPKRIEQLLLNAKAAGYFDSAARGTYRLNAVGHNLVAHTLPRSAAATQSTTKLGRRSTAKRASPRATRRRPK